MGGSGGGGAVRYSVDGPALGEAGTHTTNGRDDELKTVVYAAYFVDRRVFSSACERNIVLEFKIGLQDTHCLYWSTTHPSLHRMAEFLQHSR